MIQYLDTKILIKQLSNIIFSGERRTFIEMHFSPCTDYALGLWCKNNGYTLNINGKDIKIL